MEKELPPPYAMQAPPPQPGMYPPGVYPPPPQPGYPPAGMPAQSVGHTGMNLKKYYIFIGIIFCLQLLLPQPQHLPHLALSPSV